MEYLLPEEYVSTMKILHSHAPQSPLADLFLVIKEELKKDVNICNNIHNCVCTICKNSFQKERETLVV